MTDVLIADLTDGLKSVRPLRTRTLWLGGVAGLLLALAYVLGFYGLRPDVTAAAMPVMAVLKPLIFVVTGASALWAVSALARPEGQLKLRHLVPIVVMLGLVIGAIAIELAANGIAGLRAGMNGGTRLCYITILCGGVAGLALLWRLWLRRSATSHPVTLGAMAGLAVSSLMAAAYAVHCTMDAAIYILLVYGLAIAAVTALAALVGGKLLRW